MGIREKISKIIKEETPINVKFKGKEISCEIKESRFVKKLEQLFQNLLNKQNKRLNYECEKRMNRELKIQKENIKMLIVKEMNIVRKQGQPTSRLTSLWTKIKKL